MKILVFSDSHGSTRVMTRAIQDNLKHGGVDRIIFLGDGIRDMDTVSNEFPTIPVDAVHGNCDGAFTTYAMLSNAVHEDIVTVGGIRFLLMHGHKLDVKTGYQRAADYAIAKKADILLFGHTHRAEDITIDGTNGGHVRLINPGSCGIYNASFALLNIVGNQVVCGFGSY